MINQHPRHTVTGINTCKVVGFGNSGGEIALDLAEGGIQTSMSVRGPVNVIPRDLFGIPIQAMAIAQSLLPTKLADAVNAPILSALMVDLTKFGLKKLPVGAMSQIRSSGRIPLIDVGTVKRIKRGQISIYPAIDTFTPSGVRFADGATRDFDAVILATGYRAQVQDFLDASENVFDGEGTPLNSGSEAKPSLFFCGFRTVATGVLREISIESRRISAAIAG